MDKTQQESLISKVRKLLALANSNANEHEAASAAAKVQDLLAQHNLSMAEVDAAHVKAGAMSEGPAPRAKTHLDLSAMYSYQRDLMARVAENNFCLHFIQEVIKADPRGKYGERRVKAHYLIGSEVNVLACTLMYEYLIGTMDRLLPWQGMEKRGKNALLWLEGCSDRLGARLRDARDEAERESERVARAADVSSRHPGAAPSQPGSGLVVLKDVHGSEADLNQDAMRGLPLGTTAWRRKEDEERTRQYLEEYNKPENIEKQRAEWARYQATMEPPAEKKPETEGQARRRREQEARYHQRQQERNNRKYAKHSAKVNSSAYRMGRQTGSEIGLDQRVSQDKRKDLT